VLLVSALRFPFLIVLNSLKKNKKKRVERPGLIKKPKAIQPRFTCEARKNLKPLLQRFSFLVLFFYQNGLLPFGPGLLIGRTGQNPSSGSLYPRSLKPA
jgi:hypothetical protein